MEESKKEERAVLSMNEIEAAKKKMWELPIFEIKYIDPINGMQFRLGQHLKIGKYPNKKEYVICDILRDSIDGEIVFLIFGEEEDGEVSLLKATTGIPVYITFEN